MHPPFDEHAEAVYVAGSFTSQCDASKLALWLQARGLQITSQWLWEAKMLDPANPVNPGEYALKECNRDLADLARANTLVVLADIPSSTGGFWFELGWWYGQGRQNICVIGSDRANVFLWAPGVRWFPDVAAFKTWAIKNVGNN